MKKILILGAGSYIGASFASYITQKDAGSFAVERTSLRTDEWRDMDWSGYDCVMNVTGKAHADIGAVSEEEKQSYYEVNCELAYETAKKAIADHVKQYIYFSSIIVYGDSSNRKKPVVITQSTKPNPSNFYGDSKWRAEQKLTRLFSEKGDGARLAIVRPPMIYGPGCKGNYKTLIRLAKKLPVFPDYRNQRSILSIGNLCEFLCCLIRTGEGGVYFPQNREYASTSELVSLLGERMQSPVRLLRILAPFAAAATYFPGKPGGMARKAFGSLTYEKSMSNHMGGAYQKYSLRDSIK